MEKLELEVPGDVELDGNRKRVIMCARSRPAGVGMITGIAWSIWEAVHREDGTAEELE